MRQWASPNHPSTLILLHWLPSRDTPPNVPHLWKSTAWIKSLLMISKYVFITVHNPNLWVGGVFQYTEPSDPKNHNMSKSRAHIPLTHQYNTQNSSSVFHYWYKVPQRKRIFVLNTKRMPVCVHTESTAWGRHRSPPGCIRWVFWGSFWAEEVPLSGWLECHLAAPKWRRMYETLKKF